MAYDQQHVMFRAIGGFGAPADSAIEHFSYGLRINCPVGPFTEEGKVAFLATVEEPTRTFHRNVQLQAHADAYVYKLSAAYIDTDGFYLGGTDQQTTYRILQSPAAGVGTTRTPWSTAMSVRLQSVSNRGNAARGRFYAPSCQLVEPTLGTFPPAAAASVAAAAAIWIAAINQAAEGIWGSEAVVSIFSQGSKADPAPAHRPVVATWVGIAPDTQRRRDNRLAENYQKSNVSGLEAVRAQWESRSLG